MFNSLTFNWRGCADYLLKKYFRSAEFREDDLDYDWIFQTRDFITTGLFCLKRDPTGTVTRSQYYDYILPEDTTRWTRSHEPDHRRISQNIAKTFVIFLANAIILNAKSIFMINRSNIASREIRLKSDVLDSMEYFEEFEGHLLFGLNRGLITYSNQIHRPHLD